MKPIILLLSLAAFTSIGVKASQNTLIQCSEDKTAAECKAYIAGLVEGYVASKQNYLPKQPTFESRYLERAFATRVGDGNTRLNTKEPACLPSVVDKNKIIEHLSGVENAEDLTAQLGDYLRSKYNCNESRN